MKYLIVLIILSAITVKGFPRFFNPENPEAKIPLPEYFGYFNYPYEEHFITTKDGYILRFFRIQAKNTKISQGLPPVYL